MEKIKNKKDNQSQLIKPTLSKEQKNQTSKLNIPILEGMVGGGNVFTQLSQIFMKEIEEKIQQQEFQNNSKNEPELMNNFDQYTLKILTMIQKKSEITRLKGLQELKQLIEERDDKFVEKFLPNFVFLYKQFTLEELPNSKNLVAINQILHSIVVKGKRHLKDYFKKIFFYWFLNINDSNLEISNMSEKAFNLVFSQDKREQAVIMCMSNFIKNFKENFEFKNDLDKHQNDIQDRILYNCLQGIKKIMLILQNENKQQFQNEFYNTIIVDQLDQQNRIANILINKKGTKIVAAFFDLYQEIFYNDDLIQKNLQFLIMITTDNLQIQNDFIQKSLWQSGLFFIQQNINKFKIKNDINNKILENIKNLGYYIGNPFYENLVIILSQINVNQNFNKFIQQTFEFLKFIQIIIRKGLQIDENRFFGDNTVTCFFECCTFLIKKRENTEKIILSSIQGLLQDFIDLNDHKKINQTQFKSIPQKFTEFLFKVKDNIDFSQNLIKNLESLNVQQKYNFNQIITSIGKVNFDGQLQQIYKNILINQNQIQIQKIISILNNKIQNDTFLKDLSERIQEYQIFILNSQNFIEIEEKIFFQIINLFIQNIYHYNDKQYIENFIQSFSKMIKNDDLREIIFKNFQKSQNQKNLILISYLIDQNLQDNIFSKQENFQFVELEINIKKQRNKEQRIISQKEQTIIYEYFKYYFESEIQNQQPLLILNNLIKNVQNFELDQIIKIAFENINQKKLYSLFYILIKNNCYQYLNTFFSICLQINDFNQIDQLISLVQKQEILNIIQVEIINLFTENILNLKNLNLKKFNHVFKSFFMSLVKFQMTDIIKNITQNHIFNQSFDIDDEFIWIFIFEVLQPILTLLNINQILPQFQESNFKIYALFLCIKRGINVSKNSQLLRFYQNIQDSIKNFVIQQELFQSFYEFLFYQCQNENLIYLNALQILVEQKEIVKKVIIEQINQNNDKMTYLISYQILPLVCDNFQQIYIKNQIQFMDELGLKLSVKNINFNEIEILENNKNLFEALDLENFNYLVYFKYLNYMIEKGNLVYFSDFISKIEEIFFYFIKKIETDIPVILEVFAFIRKISNILEMFTNKFQSFIKIDFYIYCQKKLQETIMIQQGDFFIIDMAETISRLQNSIDQNFPVNHVLQIMNSDYQSLQKAAFLSVYHYFNNVEVKEFKCEINNDANDEELIDNINKFYYQDLLKNLDFKNKYLLNWILLIQNASQQYNKCQSYQIMSRAAQILVDKHYIEFLNALFEEKNQNQLNQIVLTLDESLIQDNEFQLQMNALLIFTTNYPVNIRNYFENCDKKYIKQAENTLKNYIGPQLFQSEIELIELRQHEWKTEDFDIYVYQNTREIVAIYIKENQELQITLKVPIDYPRKQIKIDVLKKVKIDQNKINKWILRMKVLLINQNNSIINSLMFWKINLDKEFQNIEECPICYFIIHSSTRQLPKLACKTCKHKFHSACIHKWFQTSNKSECPLCKSQFL